MRTILYYLCRYPVVHAKLNNEIRKADEEYLLSHIATYTEAASLPYL